MRDRRLSSPLVRGGLESKLRKIALVPNLKRMDTPTSGQQASCLGADGFRSAWYRFAEKGCNSM